MQMAKENDECSAKDFVNLMITEDYADVFFDTCYDDMIHIVGLNMNRINGGARMYGYNWEVFINYYLEKNNSDLLIGMTSNPEQGMYAAYIL